MSIAHVIHSIVTQKKHENQKTNAIIITFKK